jgi:hypothetical protein
LFETLGLTRARRSPPQGLDLPSGGHLTHGYYTGAWLRCAVCCTRALVLCDSC